MKSVLYEASTVPKAIEKAWVGANQPDEFTIKVYETEKRGFFGFSKRSAVVSIIFDPRKSERVAKRPKYKPTPAPTYKKSEPKLQARAPQQQKIKNNRQEETTQQNAYNSWSPELVNYMKVSLQDVIDIMDIKSTFSLKVDRHLLRIDFDKPVIEAPSEERMLFASFAYLLMQFLKRKYKKGFKGCRIAISSLRR